MGRIDEIMASERVQRTFEAAAGDDAAVTYTPKGGVAVSITGAIFDVQGINDELVDGGRGETREKGVVSLRTEDVEGWQVGDLIRRNGEDWAIVNRVSQDAGRSEFAIERIKLRERRTSERKV